MSRSIFFVFLCSFVLVLTFLHLNVYTHISDDLWFSTTSNVEKDHIKWVISRYYNWSSRIFIEYALIGLINKYNLWAFFNAAMFSIFIISACSINNGFNCGSKKIINAIMVVIFILTIPKGVLFSGAIWITGSLNYLWPAALAFLGYAILVESIIYDKNTKTNNGICATLFFFSSFNEQLAVANMILIACLAMYCIVNGKKISPVLLMMVVVTAIVIVFIATSPGNKARYYLEIPRWFPTFPDLNLVQKSLLGLNLYANMLLADKSITPAIMAFCISTICKKNLKAPPIVAGIVLLIIAGISTPPETLSNVKFAKDTIYSALSLRRVFYAFIITSAILLPVVLSHKTKLITFILSGMLLCAIASSSMLGFSPTVYASGERALFIPYLFFIFISVIALVSFMSKINDDTGGKLNIHSSI